MRKYSLMTYVRAKPQIKNFQPIKSLLWVHPVKLEEMWKYTLNFVRLNNQISFQTVSGRLKLCIQYVQIYFLWLSVLKGTKAQISILICLWNGSQTSFIQSSIQAWEVGGRSFISAALDTFIHINEEIPSGISEIQKIKRSVGYKNNVQERCWAKERGKYKSKAKWGTKCFYVCSSYNNTVLIKHWPLTNLFPQNTA